MKLFLIVLLFPAYMLAQVVSGSDSLQKPIRIDPAKQPVPAMQRVDTPYVPLRSKADTIKSDTVRMAPGNPLDDTQRRFPTMRKDTIP